MKNHTFPKTYTTAGAVYRAKKTYGERFPEQVFEVVKQDGKFLLTSSPRMEVKQEVSMTPKVKMKVIEDMSDEFDGGLFDEDDGTFYEVYPEDEWGSN